MQISYSNRSIGIRVVGIVSGLLAALGVSACSGNTSTNGAGNTPPVAYSDFAVTFAHSYCSSISTCCAQANYSTSTCESSLSAWMNAAIATVAVNPHIAYDAVAGARLIDEIVAVNTACTNRTLSESMNVKLDDVFHGTVQLGGSCDQSDDCIAPDAGYVTCNAGVCELDTNSMSMDGPRVTEGQPCNATCNGTPNTYGCSGIGTPGASSTPGSCWVQDGVFCNNGTCTALPAIGQACSNYSYCQEAGHCDNSVCVADTATGACTNDDGCLSGRYCDTTSKVCTPLKANGAGCNSDTECSGGQCEQDSCRVWTVATAASCAGLLD